MPNYRIEVWADCRPIPLGNPLGVAEVIKCSNPGVAARRAYARSKPYTKRGAVKTTITITRL